MNLSISKILGVRCIFPGLRDNVDHQVPSSRLTCICQRARDRLLCFVPEAPGIRQRGSRCSGQPGNIGSGQRGTTPRGGARRLLNNGLPCGEGVVLGKLDRSGLVAEFSAPGSCNHAPLIIEARTGPFLVLRLTMPARAACLVISKEIEHRPVMTCRRREIQGLARQW